MAEVSEHRFAYPKRTVKSLETLYIEKKDIGHCIRSEKQRHRPGCAKTKTNDCLCYWHICVARFPYDAAYL